MSSNVLITGGAGYVGSHVAWALADKGCNPVVLDDLSSGRREHVDGLTLVEGRFEDLDLLEHTVNRFDIRSVVHCAAATSAPESVERPAMYYERNVVATLRMLEQLRARQVTRVVFSSSAAVYGEVGPVPVTEDHETRPINPYGRTKLACEWMIRDLGFDHVCLRYFNVVGADDEGRTGQSGDGDNLFRAAIQAALNGTRFRLFGTDHPTPDGTAVRDLVHAIDLARAHVLALRHLRAGGPSLTLNVGSGTGHSVRQVVEAIGRLSGRTIDVEECPRRPGDPASVVADASRAKRHLGWEQSGGGLDAMVFSALSWARAQGPTPLRA